MSNKENILAKLDRRRQLDSAIVTLLLDEPNCLDGDFQKEEAYQVAIDYFVAKEDKIQTTAEANPAGSDAIKLANLVDSYTEAEKNGRIRYAKRIARFLQQTPTKWLELIPEDTREVAFDIVIQYLESQMCS